MKTLLSNSAMAFTLLASATWAGGWNTNAHNVVLDGYDVVAYHTTATAVEGRKDFSADYDGATFYFASAENRQAFNETPGKYLPKYNGY
jgi:YHS domain-containing protein